MQNQITYKKKNDNRIFKLFVMHFINLPSRRKQKMVMENSVQICCNLQTTCESMLLCIPLSVPKNIVFVSRNIILDKTFLCIFFK